MSAIQTRFFAEPETRSLSKRKRRFPRYKAFSLLVHGLMITLLLVCRLAGSPAHAYGYSLQGRYTAISMATLAERAQQAFSSGTPLLKDVTELNGITELEGYVVDKERKDIILIGKSGAGPAIHLDDLVVNIRSIWNSGVAPYCSLEPTSGDIMAVQQALANKQNAATREEWSRLIDQIKSHWGLQSVEIRGIPRDSRHAHIMVEADYHMKKVSLGLTGFAHVSSYLTRNLSAIEAAKRAGDEAAGPGSSMLRFWFHIKPGFPTYGDEESIVLLDKCPVVLLTEKQSASREGKIFDSDQDDDPHAVSFANDFSRILDTSAGGVKSYMQLKELFKIKAVLEAMKFNNAVADAGLDMSFYCRDYNYRAETQMPDSFPGLMNHDETNFMMQKQDEKHNYSFISMIWGGVDMAMDIDKKQFRRDKHLKKFRKAALNARPSPRSLSWTFYAD